MSDLDLGATIRGFVASQEVFARYRLVRILGRGGMGVVWLARDEKLEREVALKFPPELVVHDAGVLDDLKQETKRSLELTHDHIVRIYDFAQDAESACISMEYVDGSTLSALRVDRESKVFEAHDLLPHLEEVCAALEYAHSNAKIVHRDLKPANLMLNRKGEIKVADFGIARSLSDSMSMLTMARGISGTLVYMSPQQLDGERASHLSDIYSLGATIYELLTSRPPFYSGQVERQIREKSPASMAERRVELQIAGQDIPAHWETTIGACLAKESANRPESAAEVADLLAGRTSLAKRQKQRVLSTRTRSIPVNNRGAPSKDIAADRELRYVVLGLWVAAAIGIPAAFYLSRPAVDPSGSSAAAPPEKTAVEQRGSTVASSRSSSAQPLASQTTAGGAPSRYPPSEYVIQEPPLAIPQQEARLEQWLKPTHGSANEGRGPRQIWLVSAQSKAAVQLPDFPIPKFPGSGPSDEKITANTTGHVSRFSFSPDGTYLFRSQKLLLGVGGAYLYRKKAEMNYELVMPDLFLRACEFFTTKTGTQFKDGVGIVEFSEWAPNNTAILIVRGRKKDGSELPDWRCRLDPVARQFSDDARNAGRR